MNCKVVFAIVSIIIVGIPSALRAQQESVSEIVGTVLSATGETLPGVSVVIKGTSKGTISDAYGRFIIEPLKPGTYTLQVTSVGFVAEERLITALPGQKLTLEFRLQELTMEMESVEVVGKAETTRINEQAYEVTAISVKDLYNSATDVQRVLNRVPGMRVLQDGGLGSTLTYTLNGFSGNQIRFFMDGIPMDNFGSSLSMSNIPVNMVDHVEVYKGVVPVWLGTDALGGAVNIVTNQRANFLDASYSVGSFHTDRASLNGAYTHPKTGFTVRGNVFGNYSANDYKVTVPIVVDNNIVDTATVRRFHDGYKSGTIRLETGFVNKRFADNLLVGVIASANQKQVQTGMTMATVYGGIMQNSKSIIPTLKFRKEDLFTKGFDLSLFGAYNGTQTQIIDTLEGITYNWLGDTTYTYGSTDGEYSRTFTTMHDHSVATQLNLSYVVNEHHSFVLNYAFSYLHRSVFDKENPDKVANKYPKALTKNVVGLAYKLDPTDRLSATFFGKLYQMYARTTKDYDFALATQRTEPLTTAKHYVGYGFAASYQLFAGLQAKLSVEKALRIPEAYELFGDGLFVEANPDLGPEKSTNFNAGAAYRFHVSADHEFLIESSFIYRDSRDRIYQVVKVSTPETNYANLGHVRTLGAEGSFQYKWKDWLRMGGNITFQNITDQADSVYNESYTSTGWQKNYQKGYRIPNTPYFFANANAGVTWKDVLVQGSRLSLNYYYNFVQHYFLTWAELGSRDSKKIIPTQSSHDVEIAFGFHDGKYNISLDCQNLTNAKLYDKYYLQKPGRAFYVKIRYVL